METFDDVLTAISKNSGKRRFHLLLGNGFSVAYDSNIFSYTALHHFIEKIGDTDLKTIFNVFKTKNFELIMRQLDSFSSLLLAFEAEQSLKRRVDNASAKLKISLLDAVKSMHPEHVFKIPEDKSQACSRFLKKFLDTNGCIFSTNYDLLLYWVLLRNDIIHHVDGFGREVTNPIEVAAGKDAEFGDLVWGKRQDEQNVFYLHGALPFFDDGIRIIKEEYDGDNYILENIKKRMNAGEYPVFVTAGGADEKLSHIMHNHYLSRCYDELSKMDGSLVTFGFNFGPFDGHIISAINIAAKGGGQPFRKLLSVYIGAYTDQDKQHIREIEDQFQCKVHIFDATTVHVWN